MKPFFQGWFSVVIRKQMKIASSGSQILDVRVEKRKVRCIALDFDAKLFRVVFAPPLRQFSALAGEFLGLGVVRRAAFEFDERKTRQHPV